MRTIRLNISQALLDLFSEAIAEYTRNSRRFQSFRATVQHACARTKNTELRADDVHEFWETYPLDGSIAVWLQVSPSWTEDYDAVRDKFAEISHITVTDRAVIAFVIHNATIHRLL